MRFNFLLALALLSVFESANAFEISSLPDTANVTHHTDTTHTIATVGAEVQHEGLLADNSPIEKPAKSIEDYYAEYVTNFKLPENPVPAVIDSMVLLNNPFFIDLVYKEPKLNFDWKFDPDFHLLYYGQPATRLDSAFLKPFRRKSSDEIVFELRANAREEINQKHLNFYILRFDQLPDPTGIRSRLIEGKPLEKIHFVDDDKLISRTQKKLYVKKEQLGPWTTEASGLAQFSENTVSSNWYQGGNNNVAVLGILTGHLNYDDKKAIQWDNYGEWRMGFNSVEGDTLRMFSTNNDIFKINSKLGIKAGGNLFYSGSVDFSTQFFTSYKGINSTVVKTRFLTPVRLNVGVGFDYKYKKLLSLMLSPVSYKYIHMSNQDRLDPKDRVDPNLFGIEKGKNSLSEIGSSFKAQFSYQLTHEIQLDSRLSFYTNYKNVEVDWEIVGNMVINRFLSTRISLNPRYDNSIILPNGEKNKLQFKQLMSVGFSHKFK
ncbi:MAG TPA: DUF3078 domain-containing protein [Paludibacter sp.]|nr:DUF3078 domain-containing protein [Paludibacter sp.]